MRSYLLFLAFGTCALAVRDVPAVHGQVLAARRHLLHANLEPRAAAATTAHPAAAPTHAPAAPAAPAAAAAAAAAKASAAAKAKAAAAAAAAASSKVAAAKPASAVAKAAATTAVTNTGVATNSGQALGQIVAIITPNCNKTCEYFVTDLQQCAKGASQADIATCACSSVVLADIRTCAACISADKKTTAANSAGVVANYNGFVQLCAADGLASITGTVAVSQATSLPPRTGTVSVASRTSDGTYSVQTGAANTANVPGLSGSATPSSGSTAATGAAGTLRLEWAGALCAMFAVTIGTLLA